MVIGLLSDPVWVTSLSLGLALLFGSAAIHKLRDLKGFLAVLQSYDLLPINLLKAICLVLPLLELACAISLLFPVLRSIAGTLAVVFLLLYAAAMTLSLRQGRLIADCGCQFGEHKLAVSVALVWRNLLLAFLAATLLLTPATRLLGLYDALVIGFMLLGSCIFYLLANTLIANHLSARELSL